jgi:L-asparaginase/Glu-tRNA(Gln) amidotransferase subunit D
MLQIEEAQINCEATRRSQEAINERMRWFDEGKTGYLPAFFHSPVEMVADPFDLENLRFREPVFDEQKTKEVLVTPDLIKDFIKRINQLPDDETKPFVITIGTGGTASMEVATTGGSLNPKFGIEGLMDHEKIDPTLKEEFSIAGIDMFKTDSSQLEIDDVGDMTIAMLSIWQEMKPSLKARFNGFILVHGTDTMPKSGAHQAVMLGKGLPFNVIHTGSQRAIGEDQTDFPINLKDAFETARILHNSGFAECATVMGRHALLTIGTNKVSGTDLRPMRSPRHRPILDLSKLKNPKEFTIPDLGVYRKRESDIPFEPVIYRGPLRVSDIPAEMQRDPTTIIAMVRFSAALALLITPYQGGTYDAKDIALIASLAQKYLHTERATHELGEPRSFDIPIFAVHPSDEAMDLNKYGAAAAAFDKAGVVALDMTANAAHAMLMRALATCDTSDPHFGRNLLEAMGENLIGENSHIGARFLDKFDIVNISELMEIVKEREGKPCKVDVGFAGEYTETQIEGMAESGYRSNNLANIVDGDKEFLIAHTPFWNELLIAIRRWRDGITMLRDGKTPEDLTYQTELEELNGKVIEPFVLRLNSILNNAQELATFAQENNINIQNSSNAAQLKNELLFIWSELTGNNLLTTTSGSGPSEIYIPLVEPDQDGIIQRINYTSR